MANPAAIEPLQALATYVSDEQRDRYVAFSALAKFPQPKLTPIWIERLNDLALRGTAINTLVTIGDLRAVEPLRHLCFKQRNGDITTALALKKLGDELPIEWLERVALRKLKHWDLKERRKAVRILCRIDARDTLRPLLMDADSEVRQIAKGCLANNAGLSTTQLSAMLKFPNPDVQRTAAYQLAWLGDAAGIERIQSDLNANLVKTRLAAREAIRVLGGMEGQNR